jgi:hypothetical protein
MLLPTGLRPDPREGVNPSADCGMHLYFRSLESMPTSSVTSICDHLLGDLYLRSLNSEPSSAPGLDFRHLLSDLDLRPFLDACSILAIHVEVTSID